MKDLFSSTASRGSYGTKTATGNSRIYNCKHCHRAFTRDEHLTRHILSTHNKLKPFVCGICSRPFSRRDLLLRHAKNLHHGSEDAISRIRKVPKKSSSNSSPSSPLPSRSPSPSTPSHLIHQNDDPRDSPPRDHPLSIGRDSRPHTPFIPTTPSDKKMKMSVNMLVS